VHSARYDDGDGPLCSRPHRSPRRTWADLVSTVPDNTFKRMFRMNKPVFERLCTKIREKVGEEKFKSEVFLSSRREPRTQEATMYVGGFIPGEVKVAMALRILAGSSYLDMILVFAVGSTTVYDSFHEVVGWVNDTFSFRLHSLLSSKDLEGLKRISSGFAAFSHGYLDGVIGALDGIAIRIQCPSLERDDIPDPGNYFCRKHFYALNVQAIVDSKKRFIWVSPGHQGSMYDSVAFGQTQLHKVLGMLAGWLLENGLYLIGDCAYELATWMVVPYEDADLEGSVKDSFNFWHSNARIRVECAFGLWYIMAWSCCCPLHFLCLTQGCCSSLLQASS